MAAFVLRLFLHYEISSNLKNPLKKLIKSLKSYIKIQITNSRSRIIRPLYFAYDLFLKKHGDEYFSQFGEDMVLANLFGSREGGFYVDVGCFHPKQWSNTYLLHKKHLTLKMQDLLHQQQYLPPLHLHQDMHVAPSYL